MTLVLAKRITNGIRIFSDTKKTDLADVLKGTSRNVLKSIILNKELCICFAGLIGHAYSAIQELGRTHQQDIDNVKNALLKANQESNDGVDFIVASLAKEPSLIKISDGKLEEVNDQCWIGNGDAFNDYQKIFHTTPAIDREDISEEEASICNTIFRMNRAFKRLVESRIHEDVGEFMIVTASSPEGFYHEPTSLSFPGSKSIQPNISAASVEEYFASIGSFGYSILTPESPGIGVIGIHFYPGNSGALFSPLKKDQPIIYSSVSESEFIDKVHLEQEIKLKSIFYD